MILLGFGALAEPQEYEGKPIAAIGFSPESQPYSRDTLFQILPLRLGQPLRLQDVRAAIERLYATGRYADIEVDAQPSGAGVALRFLTRTNYFVGRVTVERVPEPPTQGVMANATRLELGAAFDEQDGKQATANLLAVLRSNGFYETTVTPEYDFDPETQQIQIRFVVDHKDRAAFRTPIVTGKPEVPAREIVKTTHWKGWFGWKDVTEARTQNGIDRVRRYYQKRDRLEAQVSLEKMDYDDRRVTPTLNIAAGPRVRIRVTGADMSGGKLRQLLPVFEEHSVDRDLLVEGARNLAEYWESKGYFHVNVDFAPRKAVNGAGEELIEYTVNRGERHKVVLVNVQGNRYFDTNTIRERMYVRGASLLQFRQGRYSETLLERDADAIRSLYRSNGFRDVEVNTRVEHGYGGKHTNMAIHITIQEGPQWLVAGLDVQGASPQNRTVIDNMLQSMPGQPFSEFNVGIDRDNILDYYYNHGYPDADFQWSFAPSGEANRVNLRYLVNEGQQKFVRQVLISGLDATDPEIIKERVLLEAGQPISRARLLDTQRRLYDLGIFARVDAALQNPQGLERDKYLLLDFEEARKYTVTAGFGAEIAKIGGCASCLESPAGAAGFSPRAYFGVTRRNFLGNGHILSFQSRASTLQRRGVVTYQAPQFRGSADVNLLFSALYDDSRDVRTFTARRREGSVQIGQRIDKARTMLYRLTYRRVKVEDLKISNIELIPQFLQPVRLGIVAGNYIEDRRDDPTESHRGVYHTLDLGWASRALASQSDFTRFLGRNATYHPIGLGARYVLARSLAFGWMKNLKSSREIPLPERFFAGGAASHRGFPENQAGPRDPQTGFPLGGSALLINQVELRFPLIGENIRGVLFEDSGNAYSSLDKISLRVKQRDIADFNYMVHAVGFGIRYRTPVGPVRLDLAYSINPPRYFGFKGTPAELLQGLGEKAPRRISHFQFHFSLGQAF